MLLIYAKVNRKTNFSFIVSFYDASVNQIYVTNGFRPFGKGRASEFETVEFPKTLRGSENLIYTNIPLEIAIDLSNWQPPELPPGCSNVTVWFGNEVFTTPRWQAEIPPDKAREFTRRHLSRKGKRINDYFY
jgi:hypothetical protein